jgi:hypothetical protein
MAMEAKSAEAVASVAGLSLSNGIFTMDAVVVEEGSYCNCLYIAFRSKLFHASITLPF